MTELEKMKHAQKYILDLANGVEPISGVEMGEDACLNNVRLSRCFFYVADVLGEVIRNGGIVAGRYKGGEFVLSDEVRGSLVASEDGVRITEFIRPLNEVAVSLGMKKVPATVFTEWLLDGGYLEEVILADNKRAKYPTVKGNGIGIEIIERSGMYGTYKAVTYDRRAQEFMIGNLEEIIKRWKDKAARV